MSNFMKTLFLAISFFIFLAAGSTAAAQGVPEKPVNQPAEARSADDRRPNLLRELGLSPEQARQLRSANIERRPQMEAAQRAMREATRALDAAIYSDTVNDEEVAARLRDFQAAQSEVSKLRFENELTVRKILTPEQLGKFRELRRRFADQRRDMRQDRRDDRRMRGGDDFRPRMDRLRDQKRPIQ